MWWCVVCPVSFAEDRQACSQIGSAYDATRDLSRDALTLTGQHPLWSPFLQWIEKRGVYSSEITGLGKERRGEIRLRWAENTPWEKEVDTPAGQAFAHFIAERRWTDTDFPEYFSHLGGTFGVDVVERLNGLGGDNVDRWEDFLRYLAAKTVSGEPVTRTTLFKLADDHHSASILFGQQRLAVFTADRLLKDLASFLTDCAVSDFFLKLDVGQIDKTNGPSIAATTTTVSNPGEIIYGNHCSACHGKSGDGGGMVAREWLPRPRNFVRALYRYRSTPTGALPTDGDLFRTVTVGLPGGGMPAFEGFLSEEERWSVVQYIKRFSRRFDKGENMVPVPVPPAPAVTQSRLKNGAFLYKESGCASCHGKGGVGDGRSGVDLKTSEGDPVAPRDLTQKWRFRGGFAPKDVYSRIANGMDGSSMAAYADALEASEMWDLTYHVLSLSPETRPTQPRIR